MLKESARMKASSIVSIGLKMVMCFTRGSVPRESENERRDENVENEEEKLGEHIRLGFRLGDTVDDLHFT
jgi:hypothetical protein